MPKLALLTAVGGPLELVEYPLTTPAPGTVALKLRMAGICGSDLHIYRGELPLFYPFPMGHEMVGEVVELGEGVTTDATGKPLAVGDRIVAPYFWTCGRCHACARGKSHACQNLSLESPVASIQSRRHAARGRQCRDRSHVRTRSEPTRLLQ